MEVSREIHRTLLLSHPPLLPRSRKKHLWVDGGVGHSTERLCWCYVQSIAKLGHHPAGGHAHVPSLSQDLELVPLKC